MEMYFYSADHCHEVDHPELLLPEASTSFAKDNAFLADDRCTTTYLAQNKQDGFLAIRVWRENFWDPDGRRVFLRRLERELLIWNNLAHPNIAPLYGLVFAYGKWASSVTPFYRNGTINSYLSNHPKTDPLVLLCGAAEGLAYLHSRNPPVSHGDVRGRHIFIKDDDGNGGNTNRPTAVISNIGTNYLPTPPNWIIASDDGTRWMAPEIMISESSYEPVDGSCEDSYEDPRTKSKLRTTVESDVYSFGMTMLESNLLNVSTVSQQVYTRRVPFPHRRFYGGVIHDVVSGVRPIRPGPDECPGLDDKIWDVIQKCWRHDPRERPSMAAVANVLREMLSETALRMVPIPIRKASL
ncbi:hypothetical protein E1B28_009566 [Marasmius oreades]|uniref:Protein kinase domain-containing protein n=1 Tax=Marasmius oreades TaxID=181124 RepID=A0A9P7RVJ9_9AGAR|nr:uncharacterized protein E1B28_009566 [Marasmius oreades]KAG7090450.1 hypothetical protein E1B28_009566 [Marasmius oreades]